MERKHHCQKAGQSGEESFKLGSTAKKQDDSQLSEETWMEPTIQAGMERVQGDVDKTDLLNSTKQN